MTDSNYFIDLSKKGYLSHGGSNENPYTGINNNILSWSFMGDLDTDFLKEFSLVYTEDFTDYADQLSKKFEKLTEAVQAVLKAMFKTKFNINAPGLRGKLLEAEILLSYFKSNADKNSSNSSNSSNSVNGLPPGMSTATALSGGSVATLESWEVPGDMQNMDLYTRLKNIVESYNKISKYKIPARKSMPHIAIGKASQTIKFKFAFGKCNLFDAKKEVWDPMRELYNSLISMNLKATNKNIGQYEVVTEGAIPYTNFAFVEILNTIQSTTTFKKVDMNKAVKALMDSKSAITSDTSDKEKLVSYIETELNKINSTDKEDKNSINLNNARLELLNDPRTTEDTIDKILGTADRKIGWDKKWYDTVVDGKNAKDAVLEYVNSNNDMIVSLPESKTGESLTDFKIEWPNGEKDKSSMMENISKVLHSIANFDTNVIHQSLHNAYERIVDTKQTAFYLHAGYKSIFKHSLQELGERCGIEEPMIVYGPFVPKKVTAKFDFKNLDENGYPMSGYIEIEPWNLLISQFGMKMKQM